MAAGAEIKRLRGSISAERAANLIGVASGRLRKWEERNSDPKDSGDIKAVETYFGCRLSDLKNLETVEWKERARHGHFNQPDQTDLMNRYVQVLERQVLDKERQVHERDAIIRNINEKLTVIEKTLSEAKRNQCVMYSVQAAYQEVTLPLLAGNRRKAIEKEVAERSVQLLAKYLQEGI